MKLKKTEVKCYENFKLCDVKLRTALIQCGFAQF